MAKGISRSTPQVRDDLHVRLNQSKGGGQTLPDTDRTSMERRFGADFSGVRVHTGSDAVQMNRELNAQAFTHGRDIYFGAGRYSPNISSGKRLLAHELTHVVQQTVGLPSLQRKPLTKEEKKKDLQSPRFKGNKRLQAAYDNHPPMKWGEKGEAVTKLQQALIDDLCPLTTAHRSDAKKKCAKKIMPLSTKQGEEAPDGIFGDETFITVQIFQKKYHLLNKKGEPDGKPGRDTLGKLDELFSPALPLNAKPTPTPPTPTPNPAPEAEAAVRQARAIRSAGNILFDSWGNDVRDNDNEGHVDSGRREMHTYDGQHYSGTYTNFGVVAGEYLRRGWSENRTVTVTTTRTITGSFRYRVCADIVSKAYADAGIMNHMRSTGQIKNRFSSFRRRGIGTLWHNPSTFPSEYLPGDFVATYDGHGGHSGIVTTRSSTSSAPTVIELPGPSTQVDAGTYDPASTNDVKEQPWSKSGASGSMQYLGRYTGGHHRRHH